MSTPHNDANKGDIARVVLMPGDPLRAKFVADTFLSEVKQFNCVRNMLGYTGTFGGVPVSVMGSGMGIPSMSIYSYELYNHYDVQSIIRVGSAGGLATGVELRDIVLAQGACTDSSVVNQLGVPGTFAPICDFGLLRKAVVASERHGARFHVGNVLSTDTFYSQEGVNERWKSMGVLAVEMEAAGLYVNAAMAGKKALTMATISDLPLTGEWLTSMERQTSFSQMMEIALDVAVGEYE